MNLEDFEVLKLEQTDDESGITIIEYKITDFPSSLELENLPGHSRTYPHLVTLFKAYEKTENGSVSSKTPTTFTGGTNHWFPKTNSLRNSLN